MPRKKTIVCVILGFCVAFVCGFAFSRLMSSTHHDAQDESHGGISEKDRFLISYATPFEILKGLWDGKKWEHFELPASGWQNGMWSWLLVDAAGDIKRDSLVAKDRLFWTDIVHVAAGVTNFTGTAMIWCKDGDQKEVWVGNYFEGKRRGVFCHLLSSRRKGGYESHRATCHYDVCGEGTDEKTRHKEACFLQSDSIPERSVTVSPPGGMRLSFELKGNKLCLLSIDFDDEDSAFLPERGICVQWHEDGTVKLISNHEEVLYVKWDAIQDYSGRDRRYEYVWTTLFDRAVKERRYEDAEFLYHNIPVRFLPDKTNIWRRMQTIKGIF